MSEYADNSHEATNSVVLRSGATPISPLEPAAQVHETPIVIPANAPQVSDPEQMERAELSYRERRRISKTPEFKAALRDIQHGDTPQRQLTQPDTWLHPNEWFEVEKKIGATVATIAQTAIRVTLDKDERRELLATEIDRRQMLGGILGTIEVATAVSTALVIRRQEERLSKAVETLWPDNEPTFSFLNGASHNGQEQIGIFLPGFGDLASHEEAEEWYRTGNFSKEMPIGYIDYSNKGVSSVSQLADLVRVHVDVSKLNSINFFGRSLGGMLEIALAAELGVPVKSMVLCSSPLRVQDADYGSLGNLAAKAPKRKWLATTFKLIANLWKAGDSNGFHKVGENLGQAWGGTMNGAAGLALQNELATAEDAHIPFNDDMLSQKQRDQYARAFIPGFTQVRYTASYDPSSDHTVFVQRAADECEQFCQLVGVDFEPVDVPYKGHANMKATLHKIQPWILAATIPSESPKKLPLAGGQSR